MGIYISGATLKVKIEKFLLTSYCDKIKDKDSKN